MNVPQTRTIAWRSRRHYSYPYGRTCTESDQRQGESTALKLCGAVWPQRETRKILCGAAERDHRHELTISPQVHRRPECLQYVGNRLLDEKREADRQLVVRRFRWIGLDHLAVADAHRRIRGEAEVL